jgi:hypothetical protein
LEASIASELEMGFYATKPLFYFVLKAGPKTIPDTEGQEFENEAGARAHARAVARDLMRNREAKTSHWRIQGCDDYLRLRFEYLFADVDESLDAFGTEVRSSVTAAARTSSAIGDAVGKIDASMAQLRQTIDRIDFILSSRPSL